MRPLYWLYLVTALFVLDAAAWNTDRMRDEPVGEFVYPTLQPSSVPTFPGAVGAGATTLRDGQCSWDTTVVFPITTLNDPSTSSPPDGSIRAIFGDKSGDNDGQDSLSQYPDSVIKFVIPQVAGVFTWLGWGLKVKAPCVVIAWQAAPDSGIYFTPNGKYRSSGSSQIQFDQDGFPTRNVVMSHFRAVADKDTLCDGCEAQSPGAYASSDAQGDCWAGGASYTYVQHMQCLGGNDAISDAPDSMSTIAYSLFALAYEPHATMSLATTLLGRRTAYRNAYVLTDHRVPAAVKGGQREEHIENLIYGGASRFHNWEAALPANCNHTSYNCRGHGDALNNIWYEGPDDNNSRVQIVMQNSRGPDGDAKSDWDDELYYSGNLFKPNGGALDTTQRSFLVWLDRDGEECSGTCPLSGAEFGDVSRGSRLAMFTDLDFPVTPLSAPDSAAVADSVLKYAGVPWMLKCDGSRRATNDNVRKRYLGWIENGGGSGTIDSIAQVDTTGITYGVPSSIASSGSACTDTDGDGLPDAFETRWGLDETVATGDDGRNGDPDNDGFTNMIEYLFPPNVNPTGNDPTTFTNADGTESASGWAPTFRNGADTVWVRRLAAANLPPQTGATDSQPIPTDPTSIPDVFGSWIADTPVVTARVLHFTCDSTVDGADVLDSAAFRDTATAMGLDPDVLMANKPPGCN
jgi:hypothetical protein